MPTQARYQQDRELKRECIRLFQLRPRPHRPRQVGKAVPLRLGARELKLPRRTRPICGGSRLEENDLGYREHTTGEPPRNLVVLPYGPSDAVQARGTPRKV